MVVGIRRGGRSKRRSWPASGGSWLIVVTVALWRTPERRRRYLPVGLMIVTLAAFAAVRAISLHQIDSLLYRTHVGGVRVATIIDLTLLVLTGLATMWRPPMAVDRSDQIDGSCDRSHPSCSFG
jgi:hypothetical protein